MMNTSTGFEQMSLHVEEREANRRQFNSELKLIREAQPRIEFSFTRASIVNAGGYQPAIDLMDEVALNTEELKLNLTHRAYVGMCKCYPGTIEWLHKKRIINGADLNGADLNGADLNGACLNGAYLRGAHLNGADLNDACLNGVDLRVADLNGACLNGAVLNGACLYGACLYGACLNGACLNGVDLYEADLRKADLRGADLKGADLRGTDLRGADLRGAVFCGVDLRYAVFCGADLNGVDLNGAYLIPIRDDLWSVLSLVPSEVPALRSALIEGRVDGSVYKGECACLIGTIANARHQYYWEIPGLKPNAKRPIEKWFLAIRKGDVPGSNPFAALTLQWIDEWIDRNSAN